MNYMQVYSQDIHYAAANVNAPASVVQTGGAIAVLSAQDLLNMASKELFLMAEPALLPAIDPGGIVPASSSTPTIQSGEWASIYGSNLAAGAAYWTGNFPNSLNGTSVTIDGKPAYLTFVSPGQIDLQVPNDATTGTVPVVVTTATGSATATVTLAQFAPSFFLQQDGKHVAGIIPGPNGSYSTIGPTGNSLGYPTVAAKAGKRLSCSRPVSDRLIR